MKFLLKIVALGWVLATSLLVIGCGPGYVGVYARTAPPPLQAEAYGAAPGPGYVWINGYWGYRGNGYFWNPGRWDRRAATDTVFAKGTGAKLFTRA